MMRGTITTFFPELCAGFIAADDDAGIAFVRFDEAIAAELTDGSQIEFELGTQHHRLVAENVRVIA